ncbi:MAG: CBS domain-containing protein [Candidatus Aenigmarchaeota archaeon]|nr:CBS domain-containing protein [Candidatus Aenigmarchaeota archaeon]
MVTGIKVKDAMISRVATANQSDSAEQGSKIMKEEDVGMLVIMESKKPVGIVTREDIVNKITALNKLPSSIKLKDIMSFPVVMCSPDEDLSTAARTMVKHGFERLPVVSMGKLVGLISDREVLKVAPTLIEILRERLLMKDDSSNLSENPTQGECELCNNFSEELKNVNDQWVCTTCVEEASGV